MSISPEASLVLLLSTPRLTSDDVGRLRELLYARLDWNAVLGMLAVHRTMGVAWSNIVDHVIEERGRIKASNVFKSMEVAFKGQRAMAREQIQYSAALLDELDAQGVRGVLLKGGATACLGYRSPGMRVFNDNDVLVERSSLAAASNVLRRMGYVQGSWDYRAETVRPARRHDIAIFPLNSHQTHPYMLPTPTADTLECHRVDLHFSIDLMTTNRTDQSVTDLLDNRVRCGGSPALWTLRRDDAFIFSCIHFHAEAVRRSEVERLKDLLLYKLVDIVALLDGYGSNSLDRILERVRALGYQRQVYHALAFTDALFPGKAPAALLDGTRPASSDYLDEVVDDEGRLYRWQNAIVDRFFDSNRLASLVAQQGVQRIQ